jgi:hypothetical protein
MCGRHGTKNNEQPRATNASIFYLFPPSLRHQGHFIMFIDVHLRLGEEVSETIVLNDLVPGDDE